MMQDDALDTALRAHNSALYSLIVEQHQFSAVEAQLSSFWQSESPWRLALSTPGGVAICVREHATLCTQLLQGLMPDVLRNMSPTLNKQIRTFSKHYDGWTLKALHGYPETIVDLMMKTAVHFSQKLRRYTGLNHLADAARSVLNNPSHMAKIREDYFRLVFASIQETVQWVFQDCDAELLTRCEQAFRQLHTSNSSLEAWAMWLQDIVAQCIKPFEGTPTFAARASELMLRWSFISSLVIRDLTLRSAVSFGMFHLLRLLCDEYVFYLVECALETNRCPIIQHVAEGGQMVQSLTESDDEAEGENGTSVPNGAKRRASWENYVDESAAKRIKHEM